MKTYSLHKIVEEHHFPFSPTEYSKFKYGDKAIARKFGFALAEGFIKEVIMGSLDSPFHYSKLQKNNTQLVIVPSPYCFIPTATFALKDYFIHHLNSFLIGLNIPVVQEAKIHRTLSYNDDYGSMNKSEREKAISGDDFYMDANFVKDKAVVFMDDIKITGAHEDRVKNMVEKLKLQSDNIFICFASLANPNVNPKLENILNHYFVKSLLDLNKIIANENFLLNTRVVKYIIGAQFDEFKNFIQYQSFRLQNTIYHLAIGNSYHKIEGFKTNLDYLKQLIGNPLN